MTALRFAVVVACGTGLVLLAAVMAAPEGAPRPCYAIAGAFVLGGDCRPPPVDKPPPGGEGDAALLRRK